MKKVSKATQGTLQSCKFSKCLFPILWLKQISQSVNMYCLHKVAASKIFPGMASMYSSDWSRHFSTYESVDVG